MRLDPTSEGVVKAQQVEARPRLRRRSRAAIVVRRGTSRAVLLALVIAVAGACAAAENAGARLATTAPGSVARIRVVISAARFTMNEDASAPRGAAAEFLLENDSGATARFALLGHVSRPVAPHSRGGLIVFLLRRGSFIATISLSTHHTLREAFIVF